MFLTELNEVFQFGAEDVPEVIGRVREETIEPVDERERRRRIVRVRKRV